MLFFVATQSDVACLVDWRHIAAMIPPLQCPVCQADLWLSDDDSALRCDANHTFDIAREGFVNLLLANHKKSAQPGDTPEMVLARRQFFGAGHYAPLCRAVSQAIPQLEGGVVFDAGCGSGQILARVSEEHPQTLCLGIDISRPAIRAAAREFDNDFWVIANYMRELPVQTQSVDYLLSVMSPRNVPEFARVLKPGGEMILVVPASGHLEALRKVLLANEAEDIDKAERAIEACASHFELKDRSEVRMDLWLDQRALQQLVAMTPLGWKSSPGGQQAVAALDQLQVQAGFDLLRFTVKEVEADHVAEPETIQAVPETLPPEVDDDPL